MTDVMMSPQADIGKRSEGNETFPFNMESSSHQYHGLSKRHRHDRMFDDGARQSTFSAGPQGSAPFAEMKRFRFGGDERTTAAFGSERTPFGCAKAGGGQREESPESLVTAITANFQQELFRCHQEIARLQSFEASIHQVQSDNKTLNEENKILKRAVAIQDHRLREITANGQRELESQQQQFHHVVQQAAEKISVLEKENRTLRNALELVNTPRSFNGGPHLPPDVF